MAATSLSLTAAVSICARALRPVAAVLCSLLIRSAYAQPTLPPLGRAADSAPSHLPGDAIGETSSSSEIAAPLFASPTRRDRIGRVVAPVMVNGKGPFRFVVDTGSSASAISPQLATALGLTPDTGAQFMLRGVTGSEPVPVLRVQRLEAGDFALEDLRLPMVANVMAGLDGVLGVEGFADKRIEIDFVHDRIQIATSRGQRPAREFYAVPMRFRFGQLPVVDALIGRVRVKAVIDTGAERTLGNIALRNALGIRLDGHQPPLATEVIGATAALQPGNLSQTPPIKLGDAEIVDVTVTFGNIYVFKLWDLEKEPALVLGMDVLGVLDTLVIDYHRRELQLRARAPFPHFIAH